jgi:hypothetical protein
MADLSPTAQALKVKDAAYALPIGTGLSSRIAAALRAAVNIGESYKYSSADTLDNILAIAAELEGFL